MMTNCEINPFAYPLQDILNMYYNVMRHLNMTKDEIDKMPFFMLQELNEKLNEELNENRKSNI